MDDFDYVPLTLTSLHRAILIVLDLGGRMSTEQIVEALRRDPLLGAPDADADDVEGALLELARDERVQPADWTIIACV